MITQEQAMAALDGFVRSGPVAVEQALAHVESGELRDFSDVLYQVADAVASMADAR